MWKTFQKFTKMDTKKKLRRVFSDEFKKEMVKKIVSGEVTVSELGMAIGMKNVNPIYLWVKKYHPEGLIEKVVYETESDFLKAKTYAKQVGDLEKIIGQMHVKIRLLEEVIQESSTHHGEDQMKKFLKK
jgi:transposase-like protein